MTTCIRTALCNHGSNIQYGKFWQCKKCERCLFRHACYATKSIYCALRHDSSSNVLIDAIEINEQSDRHNDHHRVSCSKYHTVKMKLKLCFHTVSHKHNHAPLFSSANEFTKVKFRFIHERSIRSFIHAFLFAVADFTTSSGVFSIDHR